MARHKEFVGNRSVDHVSSNELVQLPNPMVLFDDVWLGFDMWGKRKGLQVSDPTPMEEKMYRLGINQLLHSYLKGIYPNVITVDAAKMSRLLAESTDRIASTRQLLPIFLDSLVGAEHPKFDIQRLDLCRITDSAGSDLGLGNRPNTQNIETQLNNLSRIFRGGRYNGVVLVDDVVGPHATTVLKIRDMLKASNIDVHSVIAAATFMGGREALLESGISLVALYGDDVTNNGDILNTRDLLPYHPYGGLKGRTTLLGVDKVTVDMSFPYIPPFFPRTLSNRKLFIVPEAEKLNFGRTFLTGSLLIFQHIRRHLGRPVLLGDLDAPANHSTLNKDEEVEHRIGMNLLYMSTEGYIGIS